ncbi:MAG: hypothetical protein RMK93_07230, partial [Bacteroidota bacterium]|nr:hypothetical protein [Bacteroidota bacterium]
MQREEELLRLYQLLDGELPAEHEEALFWALATNEELRTAFRQLLYLHRLLPYEPLSVPAHLEAELLQRLNLTKSRSSLFRRYPWLLAMLSTLCGIGLTATFFLSSSLPRASDATLPTVSIPTPADMSIEFPDSRTGMPATGALPPPSPTQRPTGSPVATVQAPSASSSLPVQPSAWVESPLRSVVAPYQPWGGIAPLPAQSVPPPVVVSEPKLPPLSISLRSLGMWEISAPDVPLASRAPLGLRNIAAGLFTQLSPSHAIGAEIGSEVFAQEFSSRAGTLYRQRPTLFWAGLSHHWVPSPSTFSPFVHTTLGGTVLGPIGKLWLGATLPISPTTRAAVGLEGTMLFYRFD